ncbi:MAG: hypothetical protein IPL86_13525 [Flavobacteriales bacterium]|nr:hypothetical protein [Flavobacteriales bacterium]
MDYSIRYYVIAVTFALATRWVAGWFPPKRKASQVDPGGDASEENEHERVAVLEVEKVNKSFHDPVTIQVLKDVDMQVARGEFVEHYREERLRQSTLLYILSTMDTDYEGELDRW